MRINYQNKFSPFPGGFCAYINCKSEETKEEEDDYEQLMRVKQEQL